MSQDHSLESLKKYLPDHCWEPLVGMWGQQPFSIKIVRSRKTKLGDYRPPRKPGATPVLSINGDLNPYAFLITLVHEWAHLEIYRQYRWGQVKPHGPEWQRRFQDLMQPFLTQKVLPPEVEKPLRESLQKGHASTASSPALLRALRRYDPQREDSQPTLPVLEELPEGTSFLLNQQVYLKGPKRRTRYLCQRQSNGRSYAVHGQAEVYPLDPPETS
ncbi:MAG: hypothetical protein RI842_03380 [Schleiferiaceae bacterium]|nr:hypothetical protein [Schleiferiaceae bacterium]